MPKQSNNVTRSYFDKKVNQIMEKLDWLIGAVKRLDEEHILLSNKVSEHSDNLEIVNEKLGIQA